MSTSPPVICVDRFRVECHPDGTVRLYFGEAPDAQSDPVLHVGVSMSTQNAESLISVAHQTMAQHKAKAALNADKDRPGNVTPIK